MKLFAVFKAIFLSEAAQRGLTVSCQAVLPLFSAVCNRLKVWDYDLAFNEVGIDTAHNLCPTRFRGQRTSVRWLDVRSSYCLESGFIELLQREGFNIPSRAELYLYPPSNTGLQPERLWSYELSWTHRLLPGGIQIEF